MANTIKDKKARIEAIISSNLLTAMAVVHHIETVKREDLHSILLKIHDNGNVEVKKRFKTKKHTTMYVMENPFKNDDNIVLITENGMGTARVDITETVKKIGEEDENPSEDDMINDLLS